jgi:predicted alpha/beta superfamily hydrolase
MPDTVLVRVIYPVPDKCDVRLLTDADWDKPLSPHHASADRTVWTFRVTSEQPWFYCRALLRTPDGTLESQGEKYLVLRDRGVARLYPTFVAERRGTISDLLALGPRRGSRYKLRVYLPPGYAENTLRYYRVLYMQDGHNLFLPEEAYLGNTWSMDDRLDRLDAMSLLEPPIIVGIHPQERLDEYTVPGCYDYGRFVIQKVKPVVERRLRVLKGPENTAVMGSSLGGVVSFFMAWQWPEHFGMAACMSSTFGYRDDLFARVATEPRKNIRVYLDSGWPRDNYEPTLAMRDLLLRRGFEMGRDLMHFAFPDDLHREPYWAGRAHLPLQFFFGESLRLLTQVERVQKLA